MHPSALIQASPGGAKLGAWVISVLLLQKAFPEKVKGKDTINALRSSIQKVMHSFSSGSLTNQEAGADPIIKAEGE